MNLQVGDEVSIIAPASQLRATDKDLLPKAVSLLESWGLRVNVRVDSTNHFYMAGRDSIRASYLNSSLSDPRCRAIFCMRGGYGSPRLLPYLNTQICPEPKILIGSSDLTALQGAIALLWPQVDLVYGPNVATKQLLGLTDACEANRMSLHDTLFLPSAPRIETVDFIRPGKANGQLTGGCLSLLTSTLGTRFAQETANKILFLEDVGEAPYRVDRMLTQLRNASKLERVRGVVFGDMHNCQDPHNDLREVLADFFSGDSFTVAFGMRNGHGEMNLSFRIGALVQLDSNESSFRIV